MITSITYNADGSIDVGVDGVLTHVSPEVAAIYLDALPTPTITRRQDMMLAVAEMLAKT